MEFRLRFGAMEKYSVKWKIMEINFKKVSIKKQFTA